jgi:serine phosphatase RsbU (regulator of sigma subunit)
LRELLATLSEKSAEDIRRLILTSLAAFSGTAELRDDLTIVVAQFTSVEDSAAKAELSPTIQIAE